ncbi:peptidase M29 [Mesorhizobium sp. M4B.F.Ca.ET.215.01.1.1]|uniref:peptidase M29 n=1 Tax=Mesorhizobium TaxID=68287 RepID=UPI000FCCDEBE|nr:MULTISPECIES: peptidase M29 [unclassified Mesorhizobium]TGT39966.1 peptidase M29 [Mesorhizobium sp. M4B.F.Ca.ET.169.01.1.1]RUW26092.1 peptidase M29 [Mesorhizobium sp. M4B.F.Ca.ET.013.02.1.1]RVD35846.1 peptidase M29 [Mesorhizobium sp. M4B.F.Ca.ET.019.03.1.1]RWC97559.1 MAG: peptidase M29 [Mesorhizobium sp.]RWF63162.1 MAG: peptidase M29 [Mesorhizobium sp.]
MLQERIEGRWLDCFRRVFVLNAIGNGTRVAILSETQSRPVLVHLSELALHDLGAEFCMIQMPTPRQTAPVPVKSTGTSWAIQGNRAVIEALKLCEVIVDCTVEGLIHAPEWPEIEAAGRTRLLVVTNEHPEILERTEPTAELGPKVALGVQMLREAREMRVTSPAGTDLVIDLRNAPCGGTPGFGTTPGAVAHWPGGLCLAFPGKNCVNGRIVMDVGDMNLTFKTTLTSRIDFTVEDDFVTAIKGDGVDAIHFREYMEAWNDRNAYGMSHVGWGMHPRARWVSAAMYDKRDMQAVEFRALAGSFLWSTGANQYAGRYTLGHFDLPMRNCTITLDGNVVVKDGLLQGELAS